MKGHFLIGEVAKEHSISRPTLIYYDSIGLLKPSIIEDNGYRYYTFEDIEKLELILSLKESGLKLKAIQAFMAEPSHENSASLLKAQIEAVSKKIHSMEQLKITLEKRVDMIAAYENHDYYEGVQLEYYPSVRFCKVDVNYEDQQAVPRAKKNLKQLLDQSPISYGSIMSKYGHCIDKSQLMAHQYEKIKYVFDYLSDTLDNLDIMDTQESYYVRVLHKGPLYIMDESFDQLINYINQHAYNIIGDAYVVPLIDMWASKSEEDYISEIMIPVEI